MGITHRELVAALSKIQEEKAERVEKLSKEDKQKLEAAAAAKKKELEDLETQQKQLDVDAKKETDELQKLRESIAQEIVAANDEQTVFDLQRRIFDFHGTDIQSLKERLIKEGYGEQLVNYMLRFRTLEQTLGDTGGLQASFSAWGEQKNDPLERIMEGTPRLYDMTDRRVLDKLEDLREMAVQKGYLNEQEQRFLQNTGHFANTFEQNELYRQKDERGYISRASEVVESIKEQLGLDWDSTTITYGGKKL